MVFSFLFSLTQAFRALINDKNVIPNASNKTLVKPKAERKTHCAVANFLEKHFLAHKASRQKENYEPMNDTVQISETKSKNALKENQVHREERKAKNSDAKRQKYLKTEVDKSNSNWQFLSMINEYRSQVDFRPLSPSDDVVDNRISVCIRKRPLDKRETSKKEVDVVTVPNKDIVSCSLHICFLTIFILQVVVHQPQTKVDLTKYLENQKFRFDYAFDEDCDNNIVYQ